MLDLDRVQAIINRPHIVDLRDDGFTLMHPPACHPRLFECMYNLITRNNFEDPGLRGQYTCSLDRDPRTMTDPVFVIGEPAGDIEGVDWNALVAELRAVRAFERFIREYAITPYVRALTLVENWDRLVAAGDAYPGSEESQ